MGIFEGKKKALAFAKYRFIAFTWSGNCLNEWVSIGTFYLYNFLGEYI
jgi:hypothetical protein